MSVKVMTRVWESTNYTDSATTLVLLALADWANDQGTCWPSIPALARKARMSERNTRYILRKLSDDGVVTVVENRGRNHTNLYQINLQRLQVSPEENLQNDAGNLQPLQVCQNENLQNDAEYLQALQVYEEDNLQGLQVSERKPANGDTKTCKAFAAEPSEEPSRTRRVITPDTRVANGTLKLSSSLEGATANARARARPPTLPPEDFPVTPEMESWARERVPAVSVQTETEQFLAHHQAHQNKFADWRAAWRKWMLKAADFARQDTEKGGKNGRQAQAFAGGRRRSHTEQWASYASDPFFAEPSGEEAGVDGAGGSDENASRSLPAPGG